MHKYALELRADELDISCGNMTTTPHAQHQSFRSFFLKCKEFRVLLPKRNFLVKEML
jgi:hypothetical protein